MNFFYENKGLTIFADQGTSLAFDAHLHNHIELIYMLEGQTKVHVDSKEYIISAGDAFLVFPNQVHQYRRIGVENYLICIFPPEICPEFQSVFKHKIPSCPLIAHAAENKRILPVLQQIVWAKEQKTLFGNIRLKGYFLILLSELFEMMTFEESKSSDMNTVKAVLNYCAINYQKDIQLETISQALHISKYYISHLFTNKLNMGFHEYIGMLRITEACRLLQEDLSITDIAYAVGFNSTRSFNRVFLKYVEETPKEYRTKCGSVDQRMQFKLVDRAAQQQSYYSDHKR